MAGAKGPLARLFDKEGYPVGATPVDCGDDRPVVPAADAARQKLLAAVADDGGPLDYSHVVLAAAPKGPYK